MSIPSRLKMIEEKIRQKVRKAEAAMEAEKWRLIRLVRLAVFREPGILELLGPRMEPDEEAKAKKQAIYRAAANRVLREERLSPSVRKRMEALFLDEFS